jgi:hypothetical protein
MKILHAWVAAFLKQIFYRNKRGVTALSVKIEQ